MKIIEILGDNRYPESNKVIEGCRGVVIRDNKILVSRERNIDQYMIPGGGLEAGEDLKECCIRELMEETGFVVLPYEHFLRLDEYYQDIYFKNNYFLCNITGKCETALTESEKEGGLVAEWLDLDEAIGIFEGYKAYEGTNEMKSGLYYREWIALKEVKKLVY